MKRTIRIAASAAPLLVVTTLGACAPVVSHGPRVHGGTSIGVSGAMIAGEDGGASRALIPYVSDGERHADGTATQLSVQLVIPEAMVGAGPTAGILYGVQVDYYRQAASDDPSIVHGGGIQVSPVHLMPYTQVGIYSEDLGIYTTQGIGVASRPLVFPPEALFWTPGVGVEYDADVFTVRAQVSTIVLWDRQDNLEDGVPVTIGFSVQAGGHDSEPAEPVVPAP